MARLGDGIVIRDEGFGPVDDTTGARPRVIARLPAGRGETTSQRGTETPLQRAI